MKEKKRLAKNDIYHKLVERAKTGDQEAADLIFRALTDLQDVITDYASAHDVVVRNIITDNILYARYSEKYGALTLAEPDKE